MKAVVAAAIAGFAFLCAGDNGMHATQALAVAADGYRTVYDITPIDSSVWGFPAFGLMFVAIGAVLFHFRHQLPDMGPAFWRRAFPFIFLGFAVIWTGSVTIFAVVNHHRLVKAMHDGSAQVVQGKVTDFVPMPVTGHAMEHFCVQQACFRYSDYVIAGGFNHTASHGGPVRAGLPVRVTYVGNHILKLEIAPAGTVR